MDLIPLRGLVEWDWCSMVGNRDFGWAVFWCLFVHSFWLVVAERRRTKKLAVVGNGSHGRMLRRSPCRRQRRCVRVRKDGFVRRRSSTALWLRLLSKASVDCCFPGRLVHPYTGDGGPLFEILAVGGAEIADPRGRLYLSIYIYLFICLRLFTGSWEWWDASRSSLMEVTYLSSYLAIWVKSYLTILLNQSIYLSV